MKNTLLVGILLLSTSFFCRAQSWTKVDAIPITDIFSLELHNNTLYAGTKDRVYIGANNGASWKASAVLDNIGFVQTVTEFHNKIYAGTNGAGVFSSSDTGITWTPVNTGLEFEYLSAFAVWNDHLYAGTTGDGFYVFDESLNRWNQFNTNFFTNVGGNISALLVFDSDLVAAAGANGVFYKYDTTAAAWGYTYYTANLLPGLEVFSLLADSNILLASTSFPANVLLRSEDGGNNWVSDSKGIQHYGFAALAVDDQKQYIAMNSFEGGLNIARLYQRARAVLRGTTWDSAGVFSYASFIYALCAAGGRLYSASDSGLYYRGSAPVTPPVLPIDTGANTVLLYPNPAFSQANILFHSSGDQEITVQILDGLGRRIAIPYQHYKVSGGLQSLPFLTAYNASGIYFIQITGTAMQPQIRKLFIRH
jgi:hypothetical protein